MFLGVHEPNGAFRTNYRSIWFKQSGLLLSSRFHMHYGMTKSMTLNDILWKAVSLLELTNCHSMWFKESSLLLSLRFHLTWLTQWPWTTCGILSLLIYALNKICPLLLMLSYNNYVEWFRWSGDGRAQNMIILRRFSFVTFHINLFKRETVQIYRLEYFSSLTSSASTLEYDDTFENSKSMIALLCYLIETFVLLYVLHTEICTI